MVRAARGRIRVTGSPSSSRSAFIRYAVAFWKPAKGRSSTSIRCSHLTWAMPYQPGSGAPCCGGNGTPFIAQASSVSGRRASARARPRA
ncbi:MAG: hypothetical protein ACXVXU_08145 [Blastococcus sp.]